MQRMTSLARDNLCSHVRSRLLARSSAPSAHEVGQDSAPRLRTDVQHHVSIQMYNIPRIVHVQAA